MKCFTSLGFFLFENCTAILLENHSLYWLYIKSFGWLLYGYVERWERTSLSCPLKVFVIINDISSTGRLSHSLHSLNTEKWYFQNIQQILLSLTSGFPVALTANAAVFIIGTFEELLDVKVYLPGEICDKSVWSKIWMRSIGVSFL